MVRSHCDCRSVFGTFPLRKCVDLSTSMLHMRRTRLCRSDSSDAIGRSYYTLYGVRFVCVCVSECDKYDVLIGASDCEHEIKAAMHHHYCHKYPKQASSYTPSAHKRHDDPVPSRRVAVRMQRSGSTVLSFAWHASSQQRISSQIGCHVPFDEPNPDGPERVREFLLRVHAHFASMRSAGKRDDDGVVFVLVHTFFF